MKLLPPEVVGPISTCSKVVWVRGNIAGATIEIFVGGVSTGPQATERTDGIYPLTIALNPTNKITVRQTLGNDISDESFPISVQGTPDQLTALTVLTSVPKCGCALFVTGGVPGAKLQGKIGNQFVGDAEVFADIARLYYDPVLSSVGDSLTLIQTDCNNTTRSQPTAGAIPQPIPLLPPKIQKPLVECQNSITLSGIAAGALIEFYRNGKLEKTFQSTLQSEWWWIDELKAGQFIAVRQGFKCEPQGELWDSISEKAEAEVKGIDELGAPTINGSPCFGTTYLTASDLKVGARLVILSNGVKLGETDIPETSYTFKVPPLEGPEISVYMSLCDKNGPSTTVSVREGGDVPQEVKISDLYACSAYLSLTVEGENRWAANYLIYATSDKLGQISNLLGIVADRKVLLPVSPALIAQDSITLHVLGCGGGWHEFGPYTVLAGLGPAPLVSEPVIAFTNVVEVQSDHSGALIEVFVDDEWYGSAISRGNLGGVNRTPVYLIRDVIPDQSIYAIQTLCGEPSGQSSVIPVERPFPDAPRFLSDIISVGNVFPRNQAFVISVEVGNLGYEVSSEYYIEFVVRNPATDSVLGNFQTAYQAALEAGYGAIIYEPALIESAEPVKIVATMFDVNGVKLDEKARVV